MKIAIVTWTTYNNYGTQLQAFALQKYLMDAGYFPTLISDGFIKEKKKRKESYSDVRSIKITILKIKRLLKKTFLLFNRKNCFDYFNLSQKKILQFKNSYLHLDLINDVQELDKKYDIYICGSDQIWSTLNFEEPHSNYYFLDFTKKIKISYATSLGTSSIPSNIVKEIKLLLSDYYAISLRESFLVNEISSLVNKPVEWVVDPTLLYDCTFWSFFCNKVKPERKKYLLCYFLENKEWYFNYAKSLGNAFKLDTLLIPSTTAFLDLKGVYKKGVGPKEFVSLFKNADFVLTDSYHGSIFSIIFSKKFLYLKRFEECDPNNQNSRIESLFKMLDIEELIVDKKNYELSDVKTINYNKVQDIVLSFRNKSKHFLDKNLNEIKETFFYHKSSKNN